MQKLTVLLVTVFSVIFFNDTVHAQKVDSVMGVYADRFQQEKIHFHFDKSVYNKGETIWYKAYLMAGTDLSDYSKNFYVDFYDATGKLLKHAAAPVFEASAKGQFIIPANYPGQLIHVRAYTQWMLNFDSSFLYEKDIIINQPNAKTVKITPITTVQFFPEGGDIYNGLLTRIAFLATNQFGKPVSIRGAIKNSKGQLIDSLSSEHDGMGSFILDQPDINESYSVFWTDEFGNSNMVGLPAIKKTGASLQIQALSGKAVVAIKRTEVATPELKTLYLLAHMNQQLVYRSRVNLNTTSGALADIPTKMLPTGVLQITLFNALWQPVSERVIFVNNQQYQFNPSVESALVGTKRRGRNVIEINVPDTVGANLSISVTDGEIINTNNTIATQFLLCDEIKGYIYNPNYYFTNKSDSVSRNLDLVMLTHGWRRYNWDAVVQAKLPVITYPRDSDYLEIKGKVYGSAFNRTHTAQFINIIITGRDSTNKQKQFVTLPVQPDGSFVQKGSVFFDTLRLYYMFNGNKSLSERTDIRFTNGLLPFSRTSFNIGTLPPPSFTFKDSASLLRSKFFVDESERFKKLMANTTLAEVTVRAKIKSPLEKLDEQYTSGLFTGGDGYSFDFMDDPIAQSSIDMFHYLQGRIAGLNISFNNGQPILSWRNGNPELFLDEISTQADVLEGIPVSNIAYVKVFRPPFFGAFGGGGGGAIAVYTRKGNDTKSLPVAGGLEYAILGGYTPYKEFYSPNYSAPANTNDPDLRTTIYWNPYILTDPKNHKVKVDFYNNDISNKLRVIVEGVNADGKLAHIEKVIE
jgi:hypothetical protein